MNLKDKEMILPSDEIPDKKIVMKFINANSEELKGTEFTC